ncbi:response regulator [Massilia sp. CCM 9210]|uniref:response regulator n=1 Tax=Massilia scottii TaxID=3057166 RepID=UPI002796455F|nr:response regulator [Massilia sp. CCM 9210]MDQ1812344.1 response regulator [Massilia sp. CCM 9210]
MSGAPIRLLIVEDDLVDRMACRRALAADPDHAFEVFEADTGQDGLALAALRRPDCILLDYHLPDVTGLEFLTRLAGHAGLAAIPVMMLTGADSATVAAESMRRGARDYLVKDVERRYLGFLPTAVLRMLREQQLFNDKRQLEAKFRTLVEQIQAITYIAALAAEDTLTYISPQIRMLGFSPAEWLATSGLHARQMHPDDRARALRAISDSRRAGSALRHEYRLLTRTGEALWFRDEAEVVTDEAGQHLFMQGILVDITRSKLAEQALLSSQDELRKLAAHQEAIKERERKHIAQEIHDELGGLLTGINAHISVAIERALLAGAEPDPLMVDAAALAKEAMGAVRKVITDLRPSVLDQLGVWAALEWYAEQVGKRSGLHCECSIAPSLLALELDPERSTMLFRIVQEALTNVVRHAEAAHVRVTVARHGDRLLLRVHDDGKGIAPERSRNKESWGIRGMLERARHFGGELGIAGSSEEGTTLSLELPLERTNDDTHH